MNEIKYKPTIGLEVHVELNTKTKMFCRCLNNPDERQPNVNICPICAAQPGALPVINKDAIWHILRVGAALDGRLADFTEFDRKNYFYPDIPKGYQISQDKYPLVSGGSLRGVAITRVHLEEDTAKSFHDVKTGESLVDFNRSSLPLMELVTEPVIHDGPTASAFAKELQLLLRYLGASEANMEKGQMRIEANVSVAPEGDKLGTKVEIKNLNSFRTVEKAIDEEIKRQTGVLEAGGRVVQETRGWDENKQTTFSQRLKESSHDYRYFPDPDLPKLFISEIPEFRNVVESLPELPWQRRRRYAELFGLKTEDVEVFVQDRNLAGFFDELAEGLDHALDETKEYLKVAANYITSDILGLAALAGELRLPPVGDYAELLKMIMGGEVSSRGAKDILTIIIKEGGQPRQIAKERGLFQVSDEDAMGAIVDKVIVDNKNVFEEYKAGKEKALQFLVGQAMKESKGSANPGLLKKLFEQKKG